MTITPIILIACFLLLIFENFRTVLKFKASDNRDTINFSRFWKYSILIFIIGLISTYFSFANIFDIVKIDTQADEIKPLIKTNLIYGFTFLFLSILSLINWIVIKRFKYYF